MSRFFATGSDSESESSSSGDELPQQRPAATGRTFQWSDDEEETRRVVRSARDKRFDEIRNIIKTMKNHKKIKDMANVLSDFEELTKCFDKAKRVVEKEGIPRFYIRTLYDLEEYVRECWEDREGRKLMSKGNAKCLTTLRQKLKKYNRDFEQEIEDYRGNPDKGEDDFGEEEEEEVVRSGSENEVEKEIPQAEAFKKSAAEASDEDSDADSMDWGSDSEDSSASDIDLDTEGGNLAHLFLKKTTAGDEDKRDKLDKKKKEKDKSKKKEDWTEVERRGLGPVAVVEKPRLFHEKAEINLEVVMKKLNEITAVRGKKGTDRTEQIDLLIDLRTIAAAHNLGIASDCKILFHITSAVFDYNPNIATCMKPEMWQKCLECMQELLGILKTNLDITCTDNITDDQEVLEGEGPFKIRGDVLTLVERMDEEFTKMLQACDAHSTEYVERLKDEGVVCVIIEDLMEYMEDIQASTEELCRVYLKRILHLYYKNEHNVQKIPEKSAEDGDKSEVIAMSDTNEHNVQKIPEKSEEDGDKSEVIATSDKPSEDEKALEDEKPVKRTKPKESSYEVMERLSKYIYTKDVTDRIRTCTILCHIYYHALHDRWFEARDLMLMSHLQDTIQHSDVPTQIMYNRGMVQLGLCAFRQGMIRDAHNCLVDIQSGGRAKELLAQGLLLQRQHERTPEQEKIEKRRQMPYHMHINLELLECVYLVSAMLLEIPYMAAHEFDARRRMISKNFHHVMRVSDRQLLVGPPESMREHLVAASKSMKKGKWKVCKNYIINEKMNAKVWDLFQESDKVRVMMVSKIQEESLRTYLFTYSMVYDSLSLVTLAEMFELDKAQVHSIISKMIINEELMASLDEPTQTVVMHRTEPTRLQSLALQLSEKVSSLVENNEKIMEMKQGGFFTFQNKNQQNFNQNRNQQGGYQQRDRSDRYEGGRGGRGGGRGRRGGGRGGRYGDRDDNRGGGRYGDDNRGGRYDDNRGRYGDDNRNRGGQRYQDDNRGNRY